MRATMPRCSWCRKRATSFIAQLPTCGGTHLQRPMPPRKAKPTGFEYTVSIEELDKALAELTSMGIGTALDRPAAILLGLRRAARKAQHGET